MKTLTPLAIALVAIASSLARPNIQTWEITDVYAINTTADQIPSVVTQLAPEIQPAHYGNISVPASDNVESYQLFVGWPWRLVTEDDFS